MKKRYARILAATLSAAMVFTSAPTNFSGVVEAQATPQYSADDEEALQALKDALQGVDAEDKTITMGKAVDTSAELATAIETLIDAKLSDGGHSEVTGLKIGGTAAATGLKGKITGTVEMFYDQNDDGNEDESAGTVALDAYDFQMVKLPNISTPENICVFADDIDANGYRFADLKYDNDANFYNGTTGALSAFTADASVATATLKWTGVADGGFDQLMTAPCDTPTPVTLKITGVTAADLAYYDFESSDQYVETSTGIFTVYKTVNVSKVRHDFPIEVKGYTTLGGGTDTNDTTELYAEVQQGKDKVEIKDAMSGDGTAVLDASQLAKYKVLEVNIALDGLKAGATKTSAVLIGTDTDYPEDTYITTGAIPNDWEYNKTYQKYTKQVDLMVTAADAVKVSKIDFPKALAAGVTITSGDELGKVALAETSTKTGKFYLVGSSPAVTDKADGTDTKYSVVFVSDTPLTDDTNGQGGYAAVTTGTTYGLTGADATKQAVLKKDIVAVTVAKKEIKVADVTPVNKLTKAQAVYGLTYAQLFNALEKDTDNVTYTLKGAQTADVIPCGKNTVTYVCKVLDNDNQVFDNGKDTVEVTVDVEIQAPKFNANYSAATSHVKKQSGNAAALQVDLYNDDIVFAGAIANLRVADVDYTYQWFSESKGELYGQNTQVLSIDATKMNADTYWCELTVNVKSSASTAAKAAWASVENKYTSPKRKIAVTQMDITSTYLADQEYGKINATASLTVKPATDYTVSSVKWYVEDNNGKVVATIDDAPVITTGGVATAKVPTTLNAGDYYVCCDITATGKDGSTDFATEMIALTVTQSVLPVDPRDIKFNKGDKVLTYGQAVKEIKFTPAKDAEKYGKYEWVNGNSILDAGADKTATLRYIPSDDCLNNFTYAAVATYADGYIDIDVKDIIVEKADITVTANNLEIVAGQEAKASDVTYTVTGLAAGDTLAGQSIGISVKIADTVDTTKAGTYTGAIVLTCDATGTRANYNLPVSVVGADVIVKEKAATVAPSTAPTVAPTKAPAVKAAKATVSVKAGKTVTLKLKNAPKGAKVTWSVDKKAKKALKVSKKGKVTVKKGAKKGTYKVYAKVNGKKVTFKVKVK